MIGVLYDFTNCFGGVLFNRYLFVVLFVDVLGVCVGDFGFAGVDLVLRRLFLMFVCRDVILLCILIVLIGSLCFLWFVWFVYLHLVVLNCLLV